MGSKKRSSDSLGEDDKVVVRAVESGGDYSGVPVKKKTKKEKQKDADCEEKGSNAPSTPIPNSSIKPMERKKMRKALDKERHRLALESKEAKPMQETSYDVEIPNPSASSNGLPVFHISVFNKLASADSSNREAAAEALVTELLSVQCAYEKMGNRDFVEAGSRLEAEKDDGLDNCAPSVRYAIRRLIRGVSSSRECARQGFALALSVLVGTMPSIKIDSLLKLIINSLEVSSSAKGQEARECLFGRLFAYGALARSGRLLKEWKYAENTPCIREFTSHLVSLACTKRYLQEPAVSVLLNLIEMLPVKAVVNHVLEAPGFHDCFEGDTGAGNPDALLLALKLREKISVDKEMFRRQLPHLFSPSHFFTVDHLSSIADCLKESTFCQPRVHGIWPVLVNLLFPDLVLHHSSSGSDYLIKKHKKSRKISSLEEEVSNNLKSFCEVILEGALLLSSHERKHLAFDIVLLMLPRLPACCVPIVFSYKFVQCLMDILSTKDSWLHKKGEHFLNGLSEWVKHDDVRKVFVITALGKHSNGRFDCISRIKTMKDLMAGFTSESGCLLFIQQMTNMFLDEDHRSDEPSDQSQTTDDNSEMGSIEDKEPTGSASMNSDLLKHWIAESLPSILKNLTLDPDAKLRVKKEVMKFLAVQGLFSASLGTEVTSFELQEKFKWPRTPISVALCRMCIEQLQFLLSIAQKGGGTLAEANSAETNDLGYYFMRFLGTICNIPSVSLFRSLDDEDEKAFKKLQAAEILLSREERNCDFSIDAIKIHSLRYLLIQLLLQLLLRPGEFCEASSELTICIGKDYYFKDLLDLNEEDESEDSPDTSNVKLDTLLSLLPQSSAPMRYAIEQVFRGICDDVSEDGLLRMLQVIRKDLRPARHRDKEREDDDDDEDDLLEIEESDENDTGEAGDDTDAYTDDLSAMVGVEASAAAAADAPETSDNDSDEDMDDEAMFRMDSLLAKMFHERKNHAGGDSAQSQLILFKLRILSLLEIYLHENPESPQTLLIYSNLVRALINPHTMESSEQLGQRIWGILQKMFKAKRYPKMKEALQLPALEYLLEKSLRLASRPFKKKKSIANLSKKKQSSSCTRYKMLKSLAQNSTHWILKIIDASGFADSVLEKVFQAFRDSLVAYFDSKKSQLKPEFLSEVFRRRLWVGRKIFSFLLERCRDAKSEYRRIEALEVVFETLKSLLSEGDPDTARSTLKAHLDQLSKLVGVLVEHMPEKQARRAQVRKFCNKLFQILLANKMAKPFLKTQDADTQSACESHLGEQFLALKKAE